MSYSLSYAPTNRATCKGKCKGKIDKDAIRLGTSAEGAGDYQMVSYRNLGCVTKKQFDNICEKLGSVQDVPGFDQLHTTDQQKVLDAFDATQSAAPLPKPMAKKAKTTATNGGASSSSAPATGGAPSSSTPAPAPAPAVASLPSIGDQHAFADAAKRREFAAVKELVEKNAAYVNVQPAGRWSALHQFAEGGHAEAITYLLSKGADKAAKTNQGKTALDVAKPSVAALLGGAPAAGTDAALSAIPIADQHAFCNAAKVQAQDWDFDLVKTLLETTPGLVNAQPAGRWSAIHQAAAAGDASTVKYLLSKGANRKCVTRDGQTPLDVADRKCVVLLGGKRPASDDASDEEEGDDDDDDEEEEDSDDEDYEEEDSAPEVAMPGDDD